MSVKFKIIILIVIIAIVLVGLYTNRQKQNTNGSVSEKNIRWDKFINEVCFRDMESLNETQRKAVLCFWYDAEMNSGEYSGYMDRYPDTDTEELVEAIRIIGYEEIADNYLKAVREGANDEWIETDMAYYKFNPSLSECLMEYVENNKDVIFE